MQVSLKPKIELRSRVGRIAVASGFALVLGAFAVGPAHSDGDDHNRNNGRGNQHYDNRDRGYRGPAVVYAPQPDYYYTPQPDYYSAPDPDRYYAPGPSYDAPPPQGISLFFGL